MGKWVKKKLGEGLVDRICTGKLDANAMVDGGLYRFYTCAKDYTYIDDYAFDDEALLISGNGEYVGYVHYYRGKFNAYQRTYVLRGFSIDVKYLQSYLNCFLRDRIKKEMNAGSIPFIKMGTLTDMYISYPSSLSEQRRIASILSSADKVIDSTQKLIAKYKQIKQGMMEDLLKPKEGWKKVKFDNFFEMLPNNTLSREDLNSQGGSFQNIHYGDVLIKYPYCLDCNIHEIPYINRDVKFNSTKAIDGDVIFADTAEDDTVGKCVELINVGDRKIVSGLHTYLCRPKFKMSVGYLGYFLNSNVYHNQLLPYIAGSKVSSVNRKSIAQTYICFPDLSEQCRIASILSGIDKKIESEEKVLEKYKKIKKGLMEKLLNCE